MLFEIGKEISFGIISLFINKKTIVPKNHISTKILIREAETLLKETFFFFFVENFLLKEAIKAQWNTL